MVFLDKKLNVAGTAALTLVLAVSQTFAGFNTGGHKGAVRTLSAPVMGAGRLNIGAGISVFQSDAFVENVVKLPDSVIAQDDPGRDPAGMLSTNLFLCAGLTQFWDLAIALPFYYDWLGVEGISDNGIGDLEIATKFLYPPLNSRLFYQGYYAGVTIPAGMKNSGMFPRNPYYIEGSDTNPASTFYSSEYVTLNVMVLLTFDFRELASRVPVQAHLNFGGVISSSLEHQRNTAIVSLALEYTPVDFLTFMLDFHGESRWRVLSESPDPSRDPLLLSPSVRLTTMSGMYCVFTGDISLSSRASGTRLNWRPLDGPARGYRYSTAIMPNYGIQFMLGWNGYVKEPDIDRDSIPNGRDRCMREKEDIDGFQDADGCPDRDNDGDSVADSLDKCPDRSEDVDGFQDADGCPDADNDRDGIGDSIDRCPGFSEDYDGFGDADGCPDLNNDRDGVPDSVDKCPNEAEDVDGFQDADGCPDADNDQDGVVDSLDKCPQYAGVAENRGCRPDTQRSAGKAEEFPKSQVLSGVNFRKGTAELTFDSFQTLEPVFQKLKSSPEVVIELHGHTDGIGNYERNMKLSQMQAEAVRLYLINKGIASDRIKAVGFGSSSPIGDNKTAAGRAENRRIEMVRVK